jgi:hypothetical protein
MARLLENVNGVDFSNWSAVTGIGSMLLPLNLYIPPLSDGIIRTNCPLSVSYNKNVTNFPLILKQTPYNTFVCDNPMKTCGIS